MERQETTIQKRRPYFFVDLKWVFGILFTISFGLTAIFYNLSFVTRKENFAKFVKPAVQQLLIPNGLPPEQYQGVLDYARLFPDAPLSIPETPFQLDIKGNEVLNLKKNEFESQLLDSFLKKIQEGKIDEIFASMSSPDGGKVEPPAMLETIANLMSPQFDGITKTLMRINLLFSIIWLVPFILFSHRIGKIISPGVSLLIISFPMIIGMKVGRIAFGVFLKESSTVDASLRTDLLSIYDRINKNYYWLFLFGLLLVFLAIIISAIFHRSRKEI